MNDTQPFSENVSNLASEGMDRAKATMRDAAGTVREAAGSARETLAETGGRAVDEATGFVNEQPLLALAVTGAICLAFGLLIGRRS